MRPIKPHLRRAARPLAGLALALLLTGLGGCGPKEIGAGSSDEGAASGGGAPAAELMRYPMTGASARERMLYMSNRPDVMG